MQTSNGAYYTSKGKPSGTWYMDQSSTGNSYISMSNNQHKYLSGCGSKPCTISSLSMDVNPQILVNGHWPIPSWQLDKLPEAGKACWNSRQQLDINWWCGCKNIIALLQHITSLSLRFEFGTLLSSVDCAMRVTVWLMSTKEMKGSPFPRRSLFHSSTKQTACSKRQVPCCWYIRVIRKYLVHKYLALLLLQQPHPE